MNNGVQLAILGDDLTGVASAAATAAQLLGLTATATWAGAPLGAVIRASSGVLGVSTSSRELSPAQAASSVSEVVTALLSHDVNSVIKRFDSWLRGHVGLELRTFREAGGYETVFVVGAYPTLGRTTSSGVQLNEGEPVHVTSVGKTLALVEHTSHLPTILSAAGAKNVVTLEDQWHAASARDRNAEVDQALASADFIVFDASDEDDLKRIRAELARHPAMGIACTDVRSVLSRQNAGHVVRSEKEPLRGRQGPVIAAVGSITEASRKQLAYITGRSDVEWVSTDSWTPPVGAETSRPILLIASPDPSNQDSASSRDWCAEIGTAVARVMDLREVRGLVLIGGETAKAVCDEVGAASITSLKLIGPGTCLGQLEVGTRAAIPVITRSGAVGDEADLYRLCSTLI